jgi:hypothetical protein
MWQLWAQFCDIKMPVSYGNPLLKKISQGFVLKDLCTGAGIHNDAWSSSFLQPEGKPPVKPAPTGDEDADMEAEYVYLAEYARWTCMYAPERLRDGDPATPWVEGVKGPGIGEVVVAYLPSLTTIGILNGFQKSADLYAKNTRPRKVKIWLLAAERMDVSECAEYYFNVKTIGSIEAELKDAMGWQKLPLPVPPGNIPKTKTAGVSEQDSEVKWFVALQILSVYPGTKWEDCCISEIGVME